VARTGRPATRHVAAVQRAIAILNELAAARTELGTNEIARRTGINVSTISRILATLAGGGLVDHVASTGRYRIGVGIVRLASAVDLDIRSLARPHLEELSMRLGETATLSVCPDRAVLEADLAAIRDKGWAQAIGEREEDLNAVAVPVLGRGGKLAAILGVQGPAVRFSPRAMRTAVELLSEKAAQISAAM